MAGAVLSSRGPFAGPPGPAWTRTTRAWAGRAGARRLGALAHADWTALLAGHGSGTLCRPAGSRAAAGPAGDRALRAEALAGPGWGPPGRALAELHRAEGTGALLTTGSCA